MDINELINNLRFPSWHDLEDPDATLLTDAADALSTLQAENAEMQKRLNESSEFLCYMTGGLLSKTNYTAQEMISAAEDYQQKGCGECDLRVENIRWGQVASEQDKAVERLQEENEKLRNSRDRWRKCAEEFSAGVNQKDDEHERLQAENEKLRVELEQVREANKKLCSAMMTIRRSESSERMCVEYRVDYCTALSHQETADLARIAFEDLMREDARMRGPQKED